MAVHKIELIVFLDDLHRIITRIPVYTGHIAVLWIEISFFGLRISFAEKVYITVIEIGLRNRFLSVELFAQSQSGSPSSRSRTWYRTVSMRDMVGEWKFKRTETPICFSGMNTCMEL